jgi:cyclophilin family peptidyl-prolyl cis-trans isomerase
MTSVSKLVLGLGLGLAFTGFVVAEDKPAAAAGGATTRVKLETTLGDFVLELDREKAPASVENFVRYVNEGFYNGLIFHRVMPDFMIQGGGFDESYARRTEGLHDPIKNESQNGLKNLRGTISMARTADPNSATSQFFINVVDNDNRLDPSERMPHGYAVFGKVVEGMDVVDKIRDAKRTTHPKDPGGGREKDVNPDPPIVIKKATVLDGGAAPATGDHAGGAAPAHTPAPAASPEGAKPTPAGEPAATPAPRRPPVVRPSPPPAGGAHPAPSPSGTAHPSPTPKGD